MNKYRIAIPLFVQWALNASGGMSWVKNRALHVPDAVLPSAADAAGVTPEQWRAVESVQAQLLSDGIELKLSEKAVGVKA